MTAAQAIPRFSAARAAPFRTGRRPGAEDEVHHRAVIRSGTRSRAAIDDESDRVCDEIHGGSHAKNSTKAAFVATAFRVVRQINGADRATVPRRGAAAASSSTLRAIPSAIAGFSRGAAAISPATPAAKPGGVSIPAACARRRFSPGVGSRRARAKQDVEDARQEGGAAVIGPKRRRRSCAASASWAQ